MAKRATVDLADDDEEEEQTRQCARWTRDEEILLSQCWVETSENGQIGADQTEDSFWGHIMDDFNSGTTQAKGYFCSSTAKGEKIYARAHVAYFKRSSGGSASGALGSISDFVSEELRRKLQAGTFAHEAKKQKELAITEFKELEFLMIDPDTLPEPKTSIIRKKQEKIIAKYNQE
ncbi:hypothetical protein Tco_0654005 [Tanacetum coccineum]|uniref:Uncharacterized protein n=1 Tax=Tanacetum coccineum TaxID=301880 RepID=A0ABQ4X2Y2_9ASTR